MSSACWGDCRFFINGAIDECDFWVVYEGLPATESCFCAPQNTIFVTGEPPTVRRYEAGFLNQFATIVTCQREIKHRNVVYSQQGLPWFVGKTYDELVGPNPVEKTKTLSIVCSDKQFTPEHRKRFEFAHKIKAHFGESVDLFGRGIRDFEDKWDVLAPYKYSIAIENSRFPDYLSEKLPDCFLAETFPFYCGCPNVERYFEPESLVAIDIDDFDNAVRIIERTIGDEHHYQSSRAALVRAKTTYLNQHNLFPFLVALIENKPRMTSRKKEIKLHPERAPRRSLVKRVARRLLLLMNSGNRP